VDNSNAKPTIYGTVGKARSSKDAVGERNSSPFPSKASFRPERPVRSSPKATPKKEPAAAPREVQKPPAVDILG
jgi:hypothetical protein